MRRQSRQNSDGDEATPTPPAGEDQMYPKKVEGPQNCSLSMKHIQSDTAELQSFAPNMTIWFSELAKNAKLTHPVFFLPDRQFFIVKYTHLSLTASTIALNTSDISPSTKSEDSSGLLLLMEVSSTTNLK